MALGYAIFTLFLVFLLASIINARTSPGDYWKDVMKDQPMPDAIEGLVGSASKTKKTDCDTHTNVSPRISTHSQTYLSIAKMSKLKEKDLFVNDFEPRPSVTSYHDDAEVKKVNAFVKDFEPRPSVTSYSDKSGQKEVNAFVRDFEPRPSVTSYHDDAEVKKVNAFVKDFEPRPSVTSYSDKSGKKDDKDFVNDFEPRPNVSIYRYLEVGAFVFVFYLILCYKK